MKISFGWLKLLVAGFFIGAITTYFGMSRDGWVIQTTANDQAKAKVADAIVAYATPLCVMSFKDQPHYAKALAKFNKTPTWGQSEFIMKGGYVVSEGKKLPGKVESRIAENCADTIKAKEQPTKVSSTK